MGPGSAVQEAGTRPEDPFEQWREAIRRTRECEATSPHADDFSAELRRSELGPVTLLGTSFPSVRCRRTERMARQSGAQLYHVTLLTSGMQALSRGADQRETFGPGDLSFIDSAHPYDARLFGAPDAGGPGARVEGVGIDLPAELLPLPAHQLRDLLGRRLSGRTGTGALLAEFLVSLDRRAADLQPAEASRLGAVLVDLVAAWLARELDAGSAPTRDVRQRTMVEDVRAFIRHNLHDPDLTPSAVAAAHHISVSYLHRLFTQQSQGETVAAWIRGQRLRKAHRDLADPVLHTVPIHAIAAHCGIPRASDFGRAFRAAYGLTPREHRHRALHERAEE
ncbi:MULTISPECIES: helix-turn-helix domain-containing protein [Streptomyces]|uniref:helix-turn-helix domain-containing protein n=1 Tax=Streptomyces TaxID=1883 RepID=UPI0004ABAA95|nr:MULTISPECIES: helix-turn-helix domain-containing protein [Streptomyces]